MVDCGDGDGSSVSRCLSLFYRSQIKREREKNERVILSFVCCVYHHRMFSLSLFINLLIKREKGAECMV